MKIKSDIKIDKKIRELMSSKNFNKSLDFIEFNKENLSELDYWFYLSVNHRYLEKYQI